MASFQQVILLGNLTRDPEVKYLQSGTAVCDFGLAINEREKRNNEWVDSVLFCDITAFGKTAEVVSEYCSKGSPLFVTGKLRLDTWEKDGQKRSKLKIIADRVQLLGGGGGKRQETAPAAAEPSPQQTTAAWPEEELPF